MSKKSFGRTAIYPMSQMEVGDVAYWPAPDSAAIRNTAKNTSQYGIRHEKQFMCRTRDGITKITRIR